MNKEKGFGFIGLLITIAIIGLMVWVFYKNSNVGQKNQINQGQQQIQSAHDAAGSETQYNQDLQTEVQGTGGNDINYGSALDKARSLK